MSDVKAGESRLWPFKTASGGAARQGRLINRPYLAKADHWPQAQKGVRARRASPPTVTA